MMSVSGTLASVEGGVVCELQSPFSQGVLHIGRGRGRAMRGEQQSNLGTGLSHR
jgi:hypothetical protein